MLRALKLKNFKGFSAAEFTPLKPLTVISGPNNAGKSTILQAIHFLASSQRSGGFMFGDIGFTLQGFRELVYKHDPHLSIGIDLAFEIDVQTKKDMKGAREEDDPQFADLKVAEAEFMTYHLEFSNASWPDSEVIELDGFPIVTHKVEESMSRVTRGREEPSGGYGPPNDGPLRFQISPQGGPLGYMAVTAVRNTLRRVQYFSPSRRGDVYSASVSQEQDTVGFQGEHTVSRLFYLLANEPEKYERIKDWVRRFDPAIRDVVSPLRRGETSVLVDESGIQYNLATMGYGLAQALPIIVQVCDSPPGSVFLIEEPEIHLHPEAQGVLLDLMLEMIGEGNQFIVTTHSISFLTDLRWRIGKKEIDPNDAAGFIVSKKKGERHVESEDLAQKQLPAFAKSMNVLQGFT